MNKKEIKKYFDRRPAAQELYVVGNIVFINPDEAQAYSNHTGSLMETKHRDDPDYDDASESLNEGEGKAEEIELQEGDTVEDVETGDVFELKEGELQKVTETEQAEVAEEKQEQTPAPVKKKNAPRKNLGK